MRRQGTPPVEGTRVHQAKGRCSYCYQRGLESGELTARPKHLYSETEIRCYSCLTWKEYSKFKKNSRTATGREYKCGLCAKLWERYGLTFEKYTSMFVQQGGACAICREEFGDILSPHVDHDHACCVGITACDSCVRGLLCAACNRGLGHFRDSIPNLLGAITYLKGDNA